jgi:hypothetical protein
MTEETTDKQQYDSDVDFERPTDGNFNSLPISTHPLSSTFIEFTFFHKAFRLEERKMYQHLRFEEISAKYW